MLFRGPDDKLNQLTSTYGRWSALPTPVHGPTITTGPGAAYTSPGRVDVLAGCGPVLCWWTYDGSAWTFYGTVPSTGVSSTPTLTSPAPGVVEAVVRDQNGALTRLRFTVTTGWRTVATMPVPSSPGESVGVAAAVSGASVAYARGLDGRLSAMAPW